MAKLADTSRSRLAVNIKGVGDISVNPISSNRLLSDYVKQAFEQLGVEPNVPVNDEHFKVVEYDDFKFGFRNGILKVEKK